MSYATTTIPSPVGPLALVASPTGLVAVLWENDSPTRVSLPSLQPDASNPILKMAEEQLAAYFKGTLTAFTIPLHVHGTPFQQQVWQALRSIPYGETRSYAHIAHQLGAPTATRAVGAANGKNPLSIIVPCHRVVGATGSLTGFAGGLPAKQFLLNHESLHTLSTTGLGLQPMASV
ncbi:MAG: methylated-DNA--[protein]-cysteine S-methyltransferase [Alphaproteobacteria bacterium]|nr:MAG: methylated-DNA--[protein]-cysteine S-methyltransferase [Alphaproteobacteria bacterium]